ncbi:MAG TPA: hypothetical protein PKA88_04290 [Polyangiaceae bacterium]|nr:hypothetical protein [Polyangiaceae bacterium]HMR75789.1 hypothetical protein [Polyangiaceae bacterium]
MEVDYRVACDEALQARLNALFAGQRTLEDVVRWGLAHAPPILIDDVVVQDEYTHDVVVTHPSGVVLVYDTT